MMLIAILNRSADGPEDTNEVRPGWAPEARQEMLRADDAVAAGVAASVVVRPTG